MKFVRIIPISLVVIFVILSCAKQSTPSGGPKDTIPPTLINSIPAQKQTQFKSQKLELEFSELIVLNNPKEQIIITPSVGKDYKIIAKKKTAILEFDKPLKDSTTYTINFRDAIQDITEKNPTKNLRIAFSTGTYIDSLSISGTIQELLTDHPVKDATVALYERDTFNIFKHKPSYITKANDKGTFKLENLKSAKYWIYAFDDKNRNLVVDSKSESYGFIPDSIALTDNITDVKIPTLHLDSRPLKIISARPYANYFNVKTSKYLKSFTIAIDSPNVYANFGEDASTIKIYNTFPFNLDSLKTNITTQDSIGNHKDTTLYVKFTNRKTDKEKFTATIKEVRIEQNKGLCYARIRFSKPIKHTNLDSAFIKFDSINNQNITNEYVVWNSHFDELEIKMFVDRLQIANDNAKKQKPILFLAKGTFISVENDTTEKFNEPINILREEDTAVLLINVQEETANQYIVELLDKNYKVINSSKNVAEIRFENIQPGGYMIRLIIDKNGNGELDLGNFYKREQPEPVYYYKNEKGEPVINLKANWEVGPLLITH